jgi:hypothetical protein
MWPRIPQQDLSHRAQWRMGRARFLVITLAKGNRSSESKEVEPGIRLTRPNPV